MQHLQGFLPVTLVDQAIPVRNDVIDRATLVAKGDATVHAACTLLAQVAIVQCENKLIVMLDTVSSRCIAAFQPLVPLNLSLLQH